MHNNQTFKRPDCNAPYWRPVRGAQSITPVWNLPPDRPLKTARSDLQCGKTARSDRLCGKTARSDLQCGKTADRKFHGRRYHQLRTTCLNTQLLSSLIGSGKCGKRGLTVSDRRRGTLGGTAAT